jgi:hypothetical protein
MGTILYWSKLGSQAIGLGTEVLGDHPDQSMLRGGVAGEEAAVARAGCFFVGGQF